MVPFTLHFTSLLLFEDIVIYFQPFSAQKYIFSCCVIIWHVKKYSNDSAPKLTHDKNFLLLPFVSESTFPLFHRENLLKNEKRKYASSSWYTFVHVNAFKLFLELNFLPHLMVLNIMVQYISYIPRNKP